ncbi:MAG: putative transcriptional acitvator, Baf family [Bacteroidetes bacterium]|nr:putative transcriptional acitvator, Baf family [Bacteroidota bacterium]
MNLIIDQGNSSVKIAVFEQDRLLLVERHSLLTQEIIAAFFNRFQITAVILCSVITIDETTKQYLLKHPAYFIELTHETPLPIKNGYSTPQTLGKDRIAAAVGANWLCPDTNLLIIDAGTAITYDIVSADNTFQGGNIAPGARIRFRALHEFTGKLPLVEEKMPNYLIGKNTIEAITAGVMQGIEFEIEGYITLFMQKYPSLSVFLTGRGSIPFVARLKNPIFAEPNLVLIGLNRILTYNAQL